MIILAVIAGIYFLTTLPPANKNKPDLMTFIDGFRDGNINEHMICPYCQAKGFVCTKDVKRKKGISGGKTTAALFTFGISMLAVGLSRREKLTQAHCTKCNLTWDF
jgi:hypothetical protein